MVDVIHFHNKGCHACKAMEPEMRKLRAAHKAWRFDTVDVETATGSRQADEFKIDAVPTTIIRKDGRGLRFVGAVKKEDIERRVAQSL